MATSNVRVLLDTVAFIFALESPGRISARAALVLEDPETIRELSAVSLIEIGIKNALRKLNMPAADVRQSIQDLDLRTVPFTPAHAFRFFELPLHHSDPFDRQIIAQALVEDIPVVTPDAKFKLYDGLKIIW